VSGIWKYQRHLDETWSQPSYFELIFDTEENILSGSGEDNKGDFRLNGSFCNYIKTIEMTWLSRVSTFESNHEFLIFYNFIFIQNEKLNADYDQQIYLK